jgi:hypothetical protein
MASHTTVRAAPVMHPNKNTPSASTAHISHMTIFTQIICEA